MKHKVLIILFILIAIFLGTGVTYSIFYSDSNINVDQKIAKFVFESKQLNHLELNLNNLNPGSVEEYMFSVTNKEEKLSNVTVEYQITIETFHFMPLEIKLYKLNGDDTETLVMNCDETYARNESNILVCNAPIEQMSYQEGTLDNYKLVVSFPSTYSDISYADLVDFLDLEINSWQKTQ